jgi:ATP/ADP translocase
MIFMVMWFIFAIVCAKVAQTKNRNAVTWFILGALLGIFALVALILLPELERRWV